MYDIHAYDSISESRTPLTYICLGVGDAGSRRVWSIPIFFCGSRYDWCGISWSFANPRAQRHSGITPKSVSLDILRRCSGNMPVTSSAHVSRHVLVKVDPAALMLEWCRKCGWEKNKYIGWWRTYAKYYFWPYVACLMIWSLFTKPDAQHPLQQSGLRLSFKYRLSQWARRWTTRSGGECNEIVELIDWSHFVGSSCILEFNTIHHFV